MENLNFKKVKILGDKPETLIKKKKKRKSVEKGYLKMLKGAPKTRISRSQEGRGKSKAKRKGKVKGFRLGQIIEEYLEESKAKERKREEKGTSAVKCKERKKSFNGNELTLEEEFEKFTLKYEEAVESQVLLRLPKYGVLEEALDALNLKKNIPSRSEQPEEDERTEFWKEDTQFLEEYNIFAQNLQDEISEEENLNLNLSPTRQFFISNDDNFPSPVGYSLEKWLITDEEEEKETFPPLLHLDEDNESLNVLFSQEKNPEKPTDEISITTPPIQFYRRNMF